MIIRRIRLEEEDGVTVPVDSDPVACIQMMWRTAQDCWVFVPGHDAKREFQRHVTRVERRGG